MISLSSELYQRCRGTLLRCSEFDDDDRLRAAFIVDDLLPFRNGLPNSRRKTERIELCIAYLVEKQFIENKFLLAVFILALRDHYIDETELWNDLNDLYHAVNNEIGGKHQELIKKSFSQEDNCIGELIEAPIELTKEHEHDQPTTDRSPAEIPTRRQKEGKTKNSLAKEKKDFFISYNRNDKDWAEWIAWQLEAEGYTTVIQAWDFRPGSNFVEAMNEAAKNAKRTIAVLSPDYVASKFTAPEWNNAFARDPTGEKGLLLPVKVRNVELDGLLRQIVYIDLVGKLDKEAKTILLAGIRQERAKPIAPPKYPHELQHQGISTRDNYSGHTDEKNIKHINPNNNVPTNDVIFLLDHVANIYGKPVSLLLTKLYEQINETNSQCTEQFKKWLADLTRNPEFHRIGQDLESWIVIAFEQHIRLLGVDNMPEIFSQYYEELPPTDRHAAILIEMAAIDIERSMLAMAIIREDNRKLRIGAKFIKESQNHLEEMENTIHAVLDLFNRYTPPDTILPEELRHDKVFDAISDYSRALEGINAHIAMSGNLSHEYINQIECDYDDLVFYTGSFIKWLKELASRASRANSIL